VQQADTAGEVPKVIHFFDKLHPIAVAAGSTHSAALVGMSLGHALYIALPQRMTNVE
jgi:hypothetical protein